MMYSEEECGLSSALVLLLGKWPYPTPPASPTSFKGLRVLDLSLFLYTTTTAHPFLLQTSL